MLIKVEIENFQSHKKTTLEFIPGTNVIIGESDAGKSAIFRAISWVIANRPLGDAFRSEWGGDTKVTLHTDDKHMVERIRTATRNEYVINGQVLKAFGSEVPEEVAAVLQIDPANIQSQMNPPFLLADTPGEAARLLNRAASIDDIDHAISNLKSTYTNIGNTLKANETTLAKHKVEIEQYKDIPAIEKKLQQVEKMEKELNLKTQKIANLKQLNSSIRLLEKELKKTEKVPALLALMKEAETKLQTWQKKRQELLNLKQCNESILMVKGKIDIIGKSLESLEKDFHKLSPEVCPLCGNKMGVELNERD
jgi:exonuclease SbcC